MPSRRRSNLLFSLGADHQISGEGGGGVAGGWAITKQNRARQNSKENTTTEKILTLAKKTSCSPKAPKKILHIKTAHFLTRRSDGVPLTYLPGTHKKISLIIAAVGRISTREHGNTYCLKIVNNLLRSPFCFVLAHRRHTIRWAPRFSVFRRRET